MSNANVFLRRGLAVKAKYNPTTTPGVNTFFHPSALAVVAGNNPVTNSFPAVDPALNWPNATLVPYGPGVTAGIKLGKYVSGVFTVTTISAVQARIITAISLEIRNDASTNRIASVLQNMIGWNAFQQFLHGIDNGKSEAIPFSEYVSVAGQVKQSAILATALADIAGFDYAQVTTVSDAAGYLRNAPALDTLLKAPFPAVRTLATSVEPILTVWPPSYLASCALHAFELDLTIDPSYLVNESDAASDLYIIIPASLSAATVNLAATAFGSEVVLPSSNPTAGYGGAIGAHIIPITALKTGNYSAYETLSPADPYNATDVLSRPLSGTATLAPANPVTQTPVYPNFSIQAQLGSRIVPADLTPVWAGYPLVGPY